MELNCSLKIASLALASALHFIHVITLFLYLCLFCQVDLFFWYHDCFEFIGSKFPGKTRDISLEATVTFDHLSENVHYDELLVGLNAYIEVSSFSNSKLYYATSNLLGSHASLFIFWWWLDDIIYSYYSYFRHCFVGLPTIKFKKIIISLLSLEILLLRFKSSLCYTAHALLAVRHCLAVNLF